MVSIWDCDVGPIGRFPRLGGMGKSDTATGAGI
jgi:hypothetical protein